jgi:hypothetical protein
MFSKVDDGFNPNGHKPDHRDWVHSATTWTGLIVQVCYNNISSLDKPSSRDLKILPPGYHLFLMHDLLSS